MARKRFAEMGYVDSDRRPTAYFDNNYSAQFDRCFMRILEVNASFTSTKVIDAHRGVEYARYAIYAGPLDSVCTVILPSGDAKKCDTKLDFDELIQPYIGQLRLTDR